VLVVLFGFSIWAVYYEFGWSAFNHPILCLVVMYLVILGYVLFRFRWAEASKKATDEKIDDLIAEIVDIKKLLEGKLIKGGKSEKPNFR